MKNLIKIISLAVFLISGTLRAQTAFVGPINTFNITASPTTASKLVRMELIKLDKYQVLDQFDMDELEQADQFDSCYAKSCLVEYGKLLNADIAVSGSIDKIGAKILISLKMINVANGETMSTSSDQFDDQEDELQRMIKIMLYKLVGMDPDPELYKRLQFNNELITSNDVGRINNSGPRMGAAFAHGTVSEFLTRPADQGGMEMYPLMSNLGYQFEVQYVGTDKFSALFEFIPSLNGLEQGKFLPSLSIMNGFRFGQSGWEFAFGPSFGVKRVSEGFFDHGNIYGGGYGRYWSKRDVSNAGFEASTPAIEENDGYFVEEHLDKRGDLKISTRWIMAFGRTFRSGALNIPVNMYYASSRGGGTVGLSVGFNITRSKKSINK